jgi:hypothetical protein
MGNTYSFVEWSAKYSPTKSEKNQKTDKEQKTEKRKSSWWLCC